MAYLVTYVKDVSGGRIAHDMGEVLDEVSFAPSVSLSD